MGTVAIAGSLQSSVTVTEYKVVVAGLTKVPLPVCPLLHAKEYENLSPPVAEARNQTISPGQMVSIGGLTFTFSVSITITSRFVEAVQAPEMRV